MPFFLTMEESYGPTKRGEGPFFSYEAASERAREALRAPMGPVRVYISMGHMVLGRTVLVEQVPCNCGLRHSSDPDELTPRN